MRILIAVHGYPPELVGGTELATRDLARALARAGHDVLVCAGSVAGTAGEEPALTRERDVDPVSGATVDVRRIARPDLYFDHWQKWASPAVGRAFDALLRAWRPDVVHVQHWLRLTGDLVLRAARAGVPAVVSLHDHHTTCLLGFRVEPGSRAACERPFEAAGCVACAGRTAPRTPWRTPEELEGAFADRARAFERELLLARVRTAPSRGHARAIQRTHGHALEVRAIAPMRAARLDPRPLLADPDARGKLVLGAWGHLVPWKGQDLIVAALAGADPGADGLRERCELHLAGAEEPDFAAGLREAARDLNVHFHGPFEPDALAAHPVTRVHAMVAAGRAVESYGLVLDEARELGLPAVLPRAGAFAERAGEGEGVAFFEPGDAGDLARALRSLLVPGRLSELRATVESRDPRTTPLVALEQHVRAYRFAIEAGPPGAVEVVALTGDTEPSDDERARVNAAWDAALAGTSARALGFA